MDKTELINKKELLKNVLAFPYLALNAWFLPRAMIIVFFQGDLIAITSIVFAVVLNLYCYWKSVTYLIKVGGLYWKNRKKKDGAKNTKDGSQKEQC